LGEALQSVLDQTYVNWECIIVNDGSPDNTAEVALLWCKKDDRFIYINKENGGLSSARNLGIGRATGDYLQFLDSDDVLCRTKLEYSLAELSFNTAKINNIVITNFRMFTNEIDLSSIPFCELNRELFNFKSVLLRWENTFSIPIHCGLFHIDLFKNFRFPEELKAKEDWIMWLCLFQNESKVCFIDEPLVYYRLHQKNMTKDNKHMLENHIKAIIYLRTIISKNDYNDYLFQELQQKYVETNKLRSTIYNYQNSATYRLSLKIKGMFLTKCFFNIIRK
jgi:glycosyltransferase involved in cell wall biosynthesis